MSNSTKPGSFPATQNDPRTDSMVRLQGSLQFESLDSRFPAGGSGGKSGAVRLKNVGPYLLEAELGRGGMGVVYRAHDVRLNRTIALKMILRADYTEAKDLHRFQVEATAVAKLQHPNIVRVYDVGTEGEVPFMALEYIEQGTLLARTQGKPQESRYAAHLVAAMADGIQHAHDHGILHRDLKPANILLRRRELDSLSGSGSDSPSSRAFMDLPVISDFGLAKKLDSKDLFTQSGMAVGTPNYMSPEQAAGTLQKVGPATDIYGLGAILYELLTGRPPFQGVNQVETLMHVIHLEAVPPRQLQPKVPVDLETICLKCLQKDPERRYQSAADLAADLRRYLRNEVILARPAGSVERLVRWCRRHPAVSGLLVILFLLLITGTSVASRFAYKADQRSSQLALETEKAERHLQRARTIIREYLTEVENDPALRESISVPLKQKLLSRAMPVLKELMQESGDTPELVTEQAKAQWLLGNIHGLLGQTQQAEAAYRTSIESVNKLDQNKQATLEQLEFLGGAYMNLGKLLLSQGRFDDSLRSLKQAEALGRSLLPVHTSSHIPRSILAHCYLDQAELNRIQGNYNQAKSDLQHVTEALGPREKFENESVYATYMMQLMLEQAQIETDTGRPQEALASYESARKYAEEYHRATGLHDEYLSQSARIDHQRGRLCDSQGDFKKAEELVTASIESMTKLIGLKPLVHSYQQNLATSYGSRGLIYAHRARMKEAEEDFNKGLQIIEQLVKVNPTYVNRRELARAHGQYGYYYLLQGEYQKCERHLSESAKIYAELMPMQPGDTDVKLSDANMHMTLGNTMLSQMRFMESVEQFQKAQQGFANLVKLCPDFTLHHILLAGAYCNMGNSQMRLSQLEDSSRSLESATKILRGIVKKEPENNLAQTFLRNTNLASAELAMAQDQPGRAVELLNDIWTRPLLDVEKPLLQKMTTGVHERIVETARTSAMAGDWAKLQTQAELLLRASKVANRRLEEMLKLCCQGMRTGDSGTLAQPAQSLVKKLKDAGHYESAERLKEFQTEMEFEPVRNLDAVKALWK